MPLLLRNQLAALQAMRPAMEQVGGFYLRHDPGMGKTLTCIAAARGLKCERIIVICQAVGIGVWERELHQWWPEISVTTLRGDAWKTPRLPSTGVLLTNYDQLAGQAKPRINALMKYRADLLILDEAQSVKGPRTDRTLAVRRVRKASHRVLLASGTPAHSPLDWWAQFRLIDPDEPMWSQSFGNYKANVAVLGGPNSNWVMGFNPAYKQLAERVALRYAHVATTADLDWPEPVYTPVPVELTPREMALYKEFEKKLELEVDQNEYVTAENVLTKTLRLQQITGGFPRTEAGRAVQLTASKLQACVALLQGRDHKKVVVACNFLPELDALEKYLTIPGKPRQWWGRIDGSVSPEKRAKIVQDFQTMENPGVLLLQYQSGGTSITLTAADALILYSLNPSNISYRQMLGRVWRQGQKKHVQILPLLAKGTRDEPLYAGLQQGLEDVDLAAALKRWRVQP